MIFSALSRWYRLVPIALASVTLGAAAPTPTSLPAPDFKPGDSWVFDRSIEQGTTGYSDKRMVLRIQHVGVDTMVVGLKVEGAPADFEDHVVGIDWSQRRIIDGQQTTSGRPLSFPLEIGKTWTSDYVDPTHYGLQVSSENHETYKVMGWEDVTTPAGTFHALRIESDDKVKAQFMAANAAVSGGIATADGATVVAHANHAGAHTAYGEFFSTFYYVPEIKYWVKSVQENYNSENVRTKRQTDILVSFKPGS